MWPLTCVSRFPQPRCFASGKHFAILWSRSIFSSCLDLTPTWMLARWQSVTSRWATWGGNLWPPYTQISTKLPSINMWGAAGPPWRLVHHHPPHRPPSHPPTNITLHPPIYLPSHPPHCPPLCHITKPQYVLGRWTAEDQEAETGACKWQPPIMAIGC